MDWITVQSARLGMSPEELARRQHLRQAADQVSVGNAITSMRTIGALDWNKFFENTSAVEAILQRDPAKAYGATDAKSRDRYRHAVEDIARRSTGDECAVAELAIELASAAHNRDAEHVRRAHVGYYLIDAGRAELEARFKLSPAAARAAGAVRPRALHGLLSRRCRAPHDRARRRRRARRQALLFRREGPARRGGRARRRPRARWR